MALFINQNQQRSELQSKIEKDLRDRVKTSGTGSPGQVGTGILEDTEEASNSSLLWVGVLTGIVLALVVFVLFIFKGA